MIGAVQQQGNSISSDFISQMAATEDTLGFVVVQKSQDEP